MNENHFLDYIIVGQGLAGSAIALQLLKRQKRILVIDEQHANSPSRVAAGLFNPVTGKNNVKTWMADEIFPYLLDFYTAAERLTGKQFFHVKPIYRPFGSVMEQNEWMGKSADSTFRHFIKEVHTTPSGIMGINDPFGGLLLCNSGHLDTVSYLEAVRAYIASENTFADSHFNEDDLQVLPDTIEYQGWRARKIIFCTGCGALSSRFHEGIPIRPLKGETLTIKTQLPEHVIVNKGVYIVPESVSGQYLVGSTYHVADKTEQITVVSKKEMEQKLADVLAIPYSVMNQTWGFRPTTPDHKPILGAHQNHSQIIIFNGLGTKGVSLAPYFSELLVRWLENEETLNKQVALTRYK